jgi:hypothetical protein
MQIITHLFRKSIKAINYLFSELVDIYVKNHTIRSKGKLVGYIGRDGFFTPIEDKAITLKGNKPKY